MRLFAAIALVVCVRWSCAQDGGLRCNYTGLREELHILEGSKNGTIVLNITDANDATLGSFQNSAPFIDLANGSLYLNATLNLDDNQEWCKNVVFWKVYVKCSGLTGTNDYFIRVDFTDDFPPEFTRSFSTEVRELMPNGTVVNAVSHSDITDRDCQSRVNIGSSTRFSIEDGDTGGAFTIDRTGRTMLARTLDYENGDTQFLLNISVSDYKSPDRKSFTTLNVKVIDLDDNDPVFNDTSYELHVAENNQTSVGVWRQTDPPLSVFDPDQHVPEKDPLVISLYDPSDSSVLEVRNPSGEVRLMKTFDREQQASVPVVMKVQQTKNAWRSSTVTLTVHVVDVNDNRPAFQPSSYNATIAEHSAVGTSVALVSATDIDSGDNAVFNYILVSGGEMFSVATKQLGGKRYGFLSVHNSSLLDKEELRGPITVTIGTQELTPPAGGGGGCASVQCQATVTVQLRDINDNSPVFQQDSYDILVDHVSPHEVIATVNATDADEGLNADLQYTLQSYGFKGCSDAVVDSTSGDVSFNENATQIEDCSVVVTACDSPLDITQQRCASVLVQISVHLANVTVMLTTSVSPAVLIADRSVVQKELSTILGVTVTIGNIVPDSTGKGSKILISAKNLTSSDSMPRDKLQLLVDGKAKEIAQFFERYQQTTSPEEDVNKAEVFSTELIALIAVAGVLLVALIVALVFVYRGRKSYRRQQRLIQRLSGVNDIYDKTGDVSKVENGTASLINNIALPEDYDETNGLGVVNPVFKEDAETSGNDGEESPRGSSSSNDDDATAVDGREETTTGSVSPDGTTTMMIHDADSGVPSDRENGNESGSETATPVMNRSNGVVGGSAYLDAVLNEASKSRPGPGGTTASELASVVADPSSLNSEGVHVDGSNHTTAVVGFEEEKKADTDEEQERAVTFTDDGSDKGEISGGDPSYYQPSSAIESPARDDEGGGDDDDDDEEVEGIMSKLGQLVRSSTPPLRHHHLSAGSSAEDEEGMPEEPEPDYAKKVRFNVQITEHDTGEKEKSVSSSGGSSGNGPGHNGEEAGGVSNEQRPEGPEDAASTNFDSTESAHTGPASFNAEEEVTAF